MLVKASAYAWHREGPIISFLPSLLSPYALIAVTTGVIGGFKLSIAK